MADGFTKLPMVVLRVVYRFFLFLYDVNNKHVKWTIMIPVSLYRRRHCKYVSGIPLLVLDLILTTISKTAYDGSTQEQPAGYIYI